MRASGIAAWLLPTTLMVNASFGQVITTFVTGLGWNIVESVIA